ncbi:hypothetical protein NLJ89_g10129 [Agrocybe chaxingu]|uniref:F-box domain-containing protein n=1 Tax=Agrocybe chaxingu TaxID=84603 RepID=A0A9W8JRW6_9AGAR|nr:hypothetical protein NLJ89_g10129 [Agrocybe chaxingu]
MNNPQAQVRITPLMPPELINAIISEVDSKQALLNLRLTSKLFREMVTPPAFRTFDIPMKSNATKLVADFLEAPHLVKFVHELRVNAQEGTKAFGDVIKDREGNDVVLYPDLDELAYHLTISRIREIQGLVLTAVAGFTNVHTLCLYFPEMGQPGYPGWDEKKEGLTYNLGYHICEALRESHIKSTLQTLEIQCLPACAILLNVLSSPSSSLTSLTITECLPKVYLRFSFWDLSTYPLLQHLHLSKVGITIKRRRSNDALQTDLEAFLFRHRGSIKTVRLEECLIAVTRVIPSFPRTWADVWRNVEENIPHLERFEFEPAPRNPLDVSSISSDSGDYIGLSYGVYRSLPGAYFPLLLGERDRADRDFPSERDDGAAWEKLQSTLDERKKGSTGD